MVASFPAVVSQSSVGVALTHFRDSFLPFASLGMGWVVPAVVGLVLGLGFHFASQRRQAGAATSNDVQPDNAD
jgi:LIVCS family branched-chain amino acid:cation transporter